MKSNIMIRKILLLFLSIAILSLVSVNEVKAITLPPPVVIDPNIPHVSLDISSKFMDPNFKQAVWVWLGKTGSPGSFTKKDIEDRLQQGTILNVSQLNISSLAGLEYFGGLTELSCYGNLLVSLPILPSTLKVLHCQGNRLSSLPALPPTLKILRCFGNNLDILPELPDTLEVLDCGINQLTSLPTLPTTLKGLACINNQLTSLPALPETLLTLYCQNNQIKSIPLIPSQLTELNISNNKIGFLANLPGSLVKLICSDNNLLSLPPLPSNLSLLSCQNNYLNVFEGSLKNTLEQFAGTKTYIPQCRMIYAGEEIRLSVGESYQLAENAIQKQKSSDGSTWENASNIDFSDLTFYDLNNEVARISASGIVTAISVGTCNLYANLNANILNIFTKITVRVEEANAGSNLSAPSASDTPTYDGSQSSWAEPEMTQAYRWELTYPGIMNNFQKSITREEFCVISVKLYEKLTGFTAISGENPFTDTSNQDILKAYNLGIVRGVSANQFAPNNYITRQEMCVMIYRALQIAGKSTIIQPGINFTFSDSSSIASWAFNEMKFCNQKNIMKGTSSTTISPLLNTPREQAIVLIKRTFETFMQ